MKSRLLLMLLFAMAPSLCTAEGQCNSVEACLKAADSAMAQGDNGSACGVLLHVAAQNWKSDNHVLNEEVTRKAAQACSARLGESLRGLRDTVKEKFSSLSTLLSGEPTTAEVAQAVVNFELKGLVRQDAQNPLAGALALVFIKAIDARINSINKLSCQSEGSRAYVCYVEVEYTSSITGPERVVNKYRFLKNAEGWFIRDLLE